MSELTLKIVTPKGSMPPVSCDSIRLTVCDDAKGREGGSYGIRTGHTKALLSLDQGEIKAFRKGEEVFSGKGGCGFATVDRNIVTAVMEDFKPAEN